MTLSRRLFLRILPTLIATLLVIGGFAYRSATREINHIYDAELVNDANTLWIFTKRALSHESNQPPVVVPDLDFSMGNQLQLNDDADDYADAHSFRIWKNGALAMQSSNAFPANVPQFTAGFSNFSFAGEAWRLYSLPISDTTLTFEVAEKIGLRRTLVSNILLNLALPLSILIPVIALVVWVVINSGLSHIRDLVHHVRMRNPDDLSRIKTKKLPGDLVPLVNSLNQLMEKLELSLTLERRFADLAAHQLKTPQAGIKLLVQMLQKADTEEERQQIITDLTASNERALHLIKQLLNLARVSHQSISLVNILLYDTIASSLADLGIILDSRRLIVEIWGIKTAETKSDGLLIRMMLDNIIDNAIKYSPDGGRLSFDISATDGGWKLTIDDEGPGILPEYRDEVFQQFRRLDNASADGAGLGLAIVAEIAKRLSIGLDLSTPPNGKGLRVTISFLASS